MKQYLELLEEVVVNGYPKEDRTGTGTLSIFGHQMRFDLSEGLPILTTKKIHLKSVIHELLWMLSGDTNIKYLKDNGVRIWDEWADENGNLGKIYGRQWRNWDGIDQMTNVVEEIKKNPDSRRLIVSSWNVGELSEMALPPCHMMFQFYVVNGKLSCQLYQRSADLFLGVPFNIASYSLLTHMVAHQVGLEVGEFIWVGGDCHLYENHIHQANLQLSRTPLKTPTLVFSRKPDTLFDYKYEDFTILDYVSHGTLSAKVAV